MVVSCFVTEWWDPSNSNCQIGDWAEQSGAAPVSQAFPPFSPTRPSPQARFFPLSLHSSNKRIHTYLTQWTVWLSDRVYTYSPHRNISTRNAVLQRQLRGNVRLNCLYDYLYERAADPWITLILIKPKIAGHFPVVVFIANHVFIENNITSKLKIIYSFRVDWYLWLYTV